VSNFDHQQTFGPALYQYDLYPEKIEHLGNVKKVYSNRGIFALKEVTGTNQDAEWLIHCYDRLLSLGYQKLPPLYKTKYGDPIVRVGRNYYYLTPWYDEQEPDAYEREEFLIEELGKIHSLTVKMQAYSSEVITGSYSTLVNRFETRQLKMEQYTESSERNTYISPFELNYLSHFHRLMRMAEEAKKRAADWYHQCEREQRFRSVLCHGRPIRSHVIFNENGEKVLINIERAVLDTPVRDLAIFFRGATHYWSWNEEDGLYWLQCYEKHFKLYPEEKTLLACYLYFPEPMFVLIDQYHNNKREFSHIDYVRRFEMKIKTMRKLRALADRILETT
jgi:spore coat protein YsxE